MNVNQERSLHRIKLIHDVIFIMLFSLEIQFRTEDK